MCKTLFIGSQQPMTSLAGWERSNKFEVIRWRYGSIISELFASALIELGLPEGAVSSAVFLISAAKDARLGGKIVSKAANCQVTQKDSEITSPLHKTGHHHDYNRHTISHQRVEKWV